MADSLRTGCTIPVSVTWAPQRSVCETAYSFRDIEILYSHSILYAIVALGATELSSLAWLKLCGGFPQLHPALPSVVSFGELLHGVTLMGDHLLPVAEEREYLCVAPEQPGVCHSWFFKGRWWFPMDMRWPNALSLLGLCRSTTDCRLIPRIKKLDRLSDWMPLSCCHPAFFPKLSLLWHRQGCYHYRIFSFGLLKL